MAEKSALDQISLVRQTKKTNHTTSTEMKQNQIIPTLPEC